MDQEFFFNGKKYLSSKKAAKLTGYTHDYIGQLCRAKKVDGKLVGRTRYVDIDALEEYKQLYNGVNKNNSKASIPSAIHVVKDDNAEGSKVSQILAEATSLASDKGEEKIVKEEKVDTKKTDTEKKDPVRTDTEDGASTDGTGDSEEVASNGTKRVSEISPVIESVFQTDEQPVRKETRVVSPYKSKLPILLKKELKKLIIK